MKHEVQAAGGVVVDTSRLPQRVLVVHRPGHDDWSLPKGKLDAGEKFRDAAVREVEEETGVRATLGAELSPVTYRDRSGRSKIVRYWLMHPEHDRSDVRVADDEVDEVRWMPFGQALRRLTYAHDRALVAEAARALLSSSGRRPLLLVRHGQAGDKSKWRGDDTLRPLTERGRRQAELLVSQLGRFGVARIISSPILRCVETVLPTALALDLPVQEDQRLVHGATPEDVHALISHLADVPTILCSHGEVIGPFIEDLVERGTDLDGELLWQKGSTWALSLEVERDGAVRITGGGYLRPPA